MKLTPEHIAAIEALLTRRETETDKEIAASLGVHKNTVAHVWTALRLAGVNVPLKERGRRRKFEHIPIAEAAEFRAWKAAKAGEQAQAQQ